MVTVHGGQTSADNRWLQIGFNVAGRVQGTGNLIVNANISHSDWRQASISGSLQSTAARPFSLIPPTRSFTQDSARSHGLTGFVTNEADGSVRSVFVSSNASPERGTD